MIFSPYASSYTRQIQQGVANPERDMTNRKPKSTGIKPDGYITPARTNKRLEARKRDYEATISAKGMGRSMAYTCPGSMKK